MNKYTFEVNITPDKVVELVKDKQDAELVHEEVLEADDGKMVATLIFEKYYFRTSNRAALIVITDNFKGQGQGHTEVRSIATGSSQGLFFNIDWGAASNFANSVKTILEEYIVNE